MAKQRLCLHCKHCYLEMETPGYSEYTPGDPGSWECRKQHWAEGKYDQLPFDAKTVLAAITMAPDCPDFELSDLGRELGVE